MVSKKGFVLILFFILLGSLYAQSPVGLKFDIDGQAFNGTFDPLNYKPLRRLSLSHNSDSYEKGYYYDYSGNKIEGRIKFENDKISFKDGQDENTDLGPDEVSSLVIGVDSFFVVKDFYFKNKLRNRSEFVKYITEFNGLTIAKQYFFRPSSSINYSVEPIVETFIIKSKGAEVWDNFSHRGFKRNIIKYFGDIPYITLKLEKGDYRKSDMFSIIKYVEYLNKFQDNERVFFDEYWQEVQNHKLAKYHAEIIEKKDSCLTFVYYKDQTKLYQANYSSFYPNIKNGDFISFYQNGEQRKLSSYLNNELEEEKIFNTNAKLMMHYHFNEVGYSSTLGRIYKPEYDAVIDSSGKNLIDSQVEFNYLIFDNATQTRTFFNFKNKELRSVYSVESGDTMYQITNIDYKINISKLQNKLNRFVNDYDKENDEAIRSNAQGISLLSVAIDENGYAFQFALLNNLHPDWDALVTEFAKAHILNLSSKRPFRFKSYKKDKLKQPYEIVIPFEFKINGFYRESGNYYHMWYHQPMFNHLNTPNFTPPQMNIPPGF